MKNTGVSHKGIYIFLPTLYVFIWTPKSVTFISSWVTLKGWFACPTNTFSWRLEGMWKKTCISPSCFRTRKQWDNILWCLLVIPLLEKCLCLFRQLSHLLTTRVDATAKQSDLLLHVLFVSLKVRGHVKCWLSAITLFVFNISYSKVAQSVSNCYIP